MVGRAGVEIAEVEVIEGEILVLLLLLMVIGAGTTDVAIVVLVVLVDKSSMLDSPLVGSLSMGLLPHNPMETK